MPEITPEKMAELESMACHILMIPTLEYRGQDALDFHDCSVGILKDLLIKAYQKGLEDGTV